MSHPLVSPGFRRCCGRFGPLLAALLNLLLPPSTHAAPRAVHTGTTLQTPYPNWMRWLPDSTKISVLSVPGTHDTMSFYGGPIAEAQTLPLLEQLRAGIRTLDIRARHIEDRLALHHGTVFQEAMFGEVLSACNTFLEQNPTETILLWLSDAGVPADSNVTRKYWDTFRWYRDESGLGARIYNPGSLISDLSLGAIRGRIVLISGLVRSGGGCFMCGLNADDIVQNEFGGPATAFEMDEKWAGIQLHSQVIELGNPGTLYENSLTGSTAGVYPIDLANGLLGYEGMASRYLKHLFAGNIHRTTGLLYMDFPGSGLIGGILAHNMKLTTNVSALAPDFTKAFNDLAYSATHEGVAAAAERATQLQTFLRNLLPTPHWNVLVSGEPGNDSWGLAVEPDGLFAQSDVIDGFTHVALGSARWEPSLATLNLSGYWTSNTLAPLSGDAVNRARGALHLLKAQFPQARWNVAVKRFPVVPAFWAMELDAVLHATTTLMDEGWLYAYTAWASAPTNRPPHVEPGGPYLAYEGVPVTFDAGQSSDPNGDALQFRWDFDGDGTWDTGYSYEPTVTWVYPDDSAPRAAVEVSDGASPVMEKVSLSLLNAVPTVSCAPYLALGTDRRLAQEFTIVDSGADSWTIQVRYGDGTPQFATNPVNRTFSLDHAFPASGYFQVAMDVRDDDGGHTLAEFRVVTDPPRLRLEPLNVSTVQVAWTNHPAPFRLETSGQPSASNWQATPGSPWVQNGLNFMTLPLTNTQRYFRLALP